MIDGKSVLAVVPARGGSKGVPGKNIRILAGKPLIAWTIDAARNCSHIDRLIVSSDDETVIRVAESFGCEAPFVRPADLATDETPGVLPVLHAVESLPGYDIVVLLQPTSPLRSATDIDGCLRFMAAGALESVASVAECPESPYWMYSLEDGQKLKPIISTATPILRRQDAPPAYSLNGAIYAVEVSWLERERSMVAPGVTAGFVMPRERSIDIDTEFDLDLTEFLLKRRSGKES